MASLAGGALLVGFGIAWVLRNLHAHGAPFGDFAAYYSGGAAWLRGGDPYASGIWLIERTLPGAATSPNAVLPFVAPPASLPLWGLLARLPYEAARVLWAGVLLVSVALLLTVPTLAAGGRLRREHVMPLALLALSFGPLVDGIALGQPALPAAAGVMLAVWCAARKRWFLATAAACVVALLKPNIALVLLAAVRGPKSAAAFGAAAAAWIAANLVVAGGPAAAWRYLDVVRSQTAAERIYDYQYSITALLRAFGLPTAAASTAALAVAVAAALATVAALVTTRATIVEAAAIACAAWFFVTPFVHDSDFVLLLFPALVLVEHGAAWRGAVGLTGAAIVAANPLLLAEGGPGIALAAVSATVAAIQLAVLRARGRLRMRVLPVVAAVALLLLGAFASQRQLPTWPAALPATFRVPPDAHAPDVWHAELAASGLLGAGPWSAFLRSLTLFGAALLGAAAGAAADQRVFRRAHPNVAA
jgi:hypothetical protein